MQYTRRDWRNRNQIKTPQGLQWLTVPVQVKGKYDQKIRDTLIDGAAWSVDHWKSIAQNYSRAPYFQEISKWLAPLYLEAQYTHISQLNKSLLESICAYLKIDTIISDSSSYKLVEGKTERLADLCLQAGADEYISGPSAMNYIDPNIFEASSIKLSWFKYEGYEPYPQLWGEFTHGVTILDLLFNCGTNSSKYMRFAPK